ncbi:MAG: FeoB-associated Cys-rich membrane protein [[Pasteurella] mairii]|uniref:Virus attachment protein p12 family n=1 Tax=[Pasteurella] mairii TaxID=757 RepID=A0A379B4V9_9PAST|nr:FeoB-associated Cys-rich membrane protein [[Pasteurella] mairii]SUB33576.1 Virus attachment protein p12 family [[Pasteurella] mairii]
MIQTILVGIIVIACVAYILWKYVLNPKRSMCDGCNKCSGKNPSCH